MTVEHWIASAPDHNGRCIVTTLDGAPVAHVAGPATAMRVERLPDLAAMVERLLRRLGTNDEDRRDAEELLFRAGWPCR